MITGSGLLGLLLDSPGGDGPFVGPVVVIVDLRDGGQDLTDFGGAPDGAAEHAASGVVEIMITVETVLEEMRSG